MQLTRGHNIHISTMDLYCILILASGLGADVSFVCLTQLRKVIIWMVMETGDETVGLVSHQPTVLGSARQLEMDAGSDFLAI